MWRRPSLRVPIATVAVVMMSAIVLSQRESDGRQPPGRNWPLPGGHWGQTRYSTLDRITPQNVKTLGGAWHVRLNGEHVQASPVVRDGVMFVPTGAQNLYALDARTGRTLWQYQSGGSGSGGRHWGVALGDGLVFLPQRDTRMLALDQKSGAIVWSHTLGDANDPAPVRPTLASPPTYAQGLVISGLQSGDQGVRGRVIALDGKTGREVWRFYTVPGPGEIGHDTWPQDNDSWRRGGAAVWHAPAVDVDLGLVYFNTGNAWPSFVGEIRAGDNLFAASVVAVELKTGKYRWHYQITHHDIWDWDAPNPVVLFDTVVNGRPRQAVAEIRTDGYLFMLDRITGRPLYPVEERAVKQDPRQKTSPTQPYPVGGDQIGPDCAPPELVPRGFVLGCSFDPVWHDQENLVVRSFGVRHAPLSYSPQNGVFLRRRVGAAAMDFSQPVSSGRGIPFRARHEELRHHRRHRQPHPAHRLAATGAVPPGVRQRDDGDCERAAVPWWSRRAGQGLRCQNRPAAVAVSDRVRRRRAVGQL